MITVFYIYCTGRFYLKDLIKNLMTLRVTVFQRALNQVCNVESVCNQALVFLSPIHLQLKKIKSPRLSILCDKKESLALYKKREMSATIQV